MKKMKGVVAVESSSPYAVYEDAKTRLKHQSLMQDYQELQRETEAMRSRMQMVKQKKLTLQAEVRFLRRRYKYLVQNRSLKPPQNQGLAPPQKLETQHKKVTKGRNYSKKESASRPPVPGFELNQKARVSNGKEATTLRSPAALIDLNQKERIHNGKEVVSRNPVPVFDLNQVSREEEEFEVNCEPMRIEEPMKCLIKGAIDEPPNDMKLSVCRNIGNGSNRTGKRKISWQDQMALRV